MKDQSAQAAKAHSNAHLKALELQTRMSNAAARREQLTFQAAHDVDIAPFLDEMLASLKRGSTG